MKALDADAIRAAMPSPPISGGAAADPIADALEADIRAWIKDWDEDPKPFR